MQALSTQIAYSYKERILANNNMWLNVQQHVVECARLQSTSCTEAYQSKNSYDGTKFTLKIVHNKLKSSKSANGVSKNSPMVMMCEP